MRFVLAALLLLAAPAEAAPRVASLGLCTDELVLLMAAPEQVATVSFLGKDGNETPLAAKAEDIPSNDGSLESALAYQPDLVVTGGPVNARARDLAREIGLGVLDLPPPTNLRELKENILRLGARLGRTERAEQLVVGMDMRLGKMPAEPIQALSAQPGGIAGSASGLSAEMLRYAGIELTAPPSLRLDRERMLLNPPELVVRSRYRSEAFSLAQSWSPPAGAWGEVWLDGRLWTCPSPLAVRDVERIREELRR